MVTKESDNGQQYKEYTTQAAGNKAYIVGAQVLGGELWESSGSTKRSSTTRL